MSTSRSDSSESISIYETPISSPSNESLINSTRINSSLFGNESATTQSIDFVDFRQSFESIPTSVATESTLRQTADRLDNECESNQDCHHSTGGSMADTSVWLPSQTVSPLNPSDLHIMLMKHMSELEAEQLELIGVEQQMQSLTLKCRSFRANISSKTNEINSLITQMLPKQKQMAQKETQTDFEDMASDPQSCDNKPVINCKQSQPKILSEQKSVPKTYSSDNCLFDLSDSLKKRFYRLPAMVKGYLTRRLMKTDKVLHKIEEIRETTQLIFNYHNSDPNKKVTEEDIRFHERLMIQLNKSCRELYDIFFNYPKSSQMALIHRSREHILERHYRTLSVLSNSSYMNSTQHNPGSPQTIGLSSVTKKVIQRKTQKTRGNSSLSKISVTNFVNKSYSLASNSPVSVKTSVKDKINSSQRRRTKPNTATNRMTGVQTYKRKANFDK